MRTKSEQEVYTPLHEFLKNERDFHFNLSTLVGLFQGSKYFRQKDETKKYIEQFNKANEIYRNSGLELLEGKSLEEKALGIAKFINSKEFFEYKNLLIDLSLAQKRIEEIVAKHQKELPNVLASDPQRPIQAASFYTIRPTQHLARYTLQLGVIDKEFSKSLSPIAKEEMHKAYVVAHNYGSDFNNQVGYVEDQNKNPKQVKRIFALNALLALNLNSPLQKSSQKEYYIQSALIDASPEVFFTDTQGQLMIKASVHFADYNKAMGINLQQKKYKIDASRFDAQTLDELYQKDNNVLWLVLKSMKPIDKTFTAQQKIEAYIQVAGAFYDAKLGDKNKFKGALAVAQTAIAVAKEHPEVVEQVNNAFTVQHAEKKGDLDKKRSGNQFAEWIIGKHEKEEKSVIQQLLSPIPFASHKLDIPSVTVTDFEDREFSRTSNNGIISDSDNELDETHVAQAIPLDSPPPMLSEFKAQQAQLAQDLAEAQRKIAELSTRNKELSGLLENTEDDLNTKIHNQDTKIDLLKQQLEQAQKIQEDAQAKIQLGSQKSLAQHALAALEFTGGTDKKLMEYCKAQSALLDKVENKQDVAKITHEVQQILGITKAVNAIVAAVNNSDKWYMLGSETKNKAQAIESSLHKIEVIDRLSLLNYDSPQTKQKTEYPQIQQFIAALSVKRGLLTHSSKETSSFNSFKENMSNLRAENEKEHILASTNESQYKV